MSYHHIKEPKAFVKALKYEVEDETEANIEHCHQLWQKPLQARLEKGVCLGPISFVNTRDKILIMHCTQNLSQFRESDILRLSKGNPFEPDFSGWDVTLERENGSDLRLSFHNDAVDCERLKKDPHGWYLDESFLDMSQIYLKALHQMTATPVGQKRVLPLLMGTLDPDDELDLSKEETATELARLYNFNEYQEDALVNAAMSDVSLLIQGPPGTGKTQLIAVLTRLLVEAGEQVLITATTHRAIANALNKIARIAKTPNGRPAIPGVKVEQPGRVEELTYQSVSHFKDWGHAEDRSGFVVGATPFACWTNRLGEKTFDTVIFDEASQVTVPLAVMAMLRAKKYFFIGDQQQLPPVYRKHRETNSSIFSLLKHMDPHMLQTTYRMNDALTRWPSQQFYQGRLHSYHEVANRRISYDTPPQKYTNILDPEAVRVWVPTPLGTSTVKNPKEAKAIAELCHQLVISGVKASEIGIVTPYRAQSRRLRSALKKVLPQCYKEIVADTVERMQGQERKVIFLSLTTTDPAFAQNVASFYFHNQRLNVSITRAEMKLIVFGCPQLGSFYCEHPELQNQIDIFRDLPKHCQMIPWEAWDG